MIVKQYILPMFESKDKKDLTKKYNKMSGMATQNQMHSKFKFGKIPGDSKAQESVYGELKLSEKLAQELDIIKEYVDSLNE